jgi:DNA-binding beta-propeller fold protein YncE
LAPDLAACGRASANPPLVQEAVIPLPDTTGRIDHLAIDVARQHLFVAELGNGSVDVVDLRAHKVVHRLSGLDEPQGVAYAPASDRLVVACGGDGSVRVYDGGVFALKGVIQLDGDADNAHLDPATGRVLVGHGSGGLAIIDPAVPAKIGDIALAAHPEGFAISGSRAFVNLPDADEIDVVDIAAAKAIGHWKPPPLSSNFPLALDDSGHVTVVFRGRARLALFDAASGRALGDISTCGDADDIFFDSTRKRWLVSCGEGVVDAVAMTGSTLTQIGRTSTSWGARTSLYVPELDRLFLAERASLMGSNAAIAVFRPAEAPK